MASHTVALVPGDGIGPEIVDAAVQVLDIDLFQLSGQSLQLLAGHVGHGAETGGGGSQLLKGRSTLWMERLLPKRLVSRKMP